MKLDDVARTLDQLSITFKKLLTQEGINALQEAANLARRSHGKFMRKEADAWGYQIFPERPVRFKPSNDGKLRVVVDLYCETYWQAEEGIPTTNSVIMRVWGLDRSAYFRPSLDHPEIENKYDPNRGRVMMKYRFDRAISGLAEPEYHLQTGGVVRPGEEPCWLHPQLEVPRLAYQPYDLTLAMEVAVANFFTKYEEAHKALRQSEWLRALRRSQEVFLLPYYQKCLVTLEEKKDSLYRSLWQKDWEEAG